MSGFGFTQLMGGGGGASDTVTVGTGGDYTTWDALLAAGSAVADKNIRRLSTGRYYRGLPTTGYPIPWDVYGLGTVTVDASLVGTETAQAQLNGWTEAGSGGTFAYNQGGELDIVIGASGDTGFLSASHSGAATDHYYASGYMTIGAQGLAQLRIIDSARIYSVNARGPNDEIGTSGGEDGATNNDTSSKVWVEYWRTPNEWQQVMLNQNGQAVAAEDGNGGPDARSLYQFGKALFSVTGTISFSYLWALRVTP